ncbi:MAG: DUF927 domain-containing protein [Proteobacteria bacterium]|nr:DUF927 domain-containing protein [Pseudomonadota bacterium]
MSKKSGGKGGKPPAQAIDDAEPAEAAGSVEAARKSGVGWIKRQFKNLETGLHILKTDEKSGKQDLIFVCGPIKVAAMTRDEHDQVGVLVEWQDLQGQCREEIFARSMFAGDGRELRSRLSDGGLHVDTTLAARSGLIRYLNSPHDVEWAHLTNRTGWHEIDGRLIFVLPDEVFGNATRRVLYQKNNAANPFRTAGTLEGWRASIAALAPGNARLIFAISTAFAGPLLDLTGQDGGGLNFKGASRVGKTTALRVAASVWGGDVKQGAAGFVQSWRATSNGLESIALQFCDTLLALDEMGQADAADVGDVAYMLSNGSGKARATRDGGSRPPARWRVLFLSTGEIGLTDKNAEARQVTKAGQEVRLVDVAADAGTGYGLFSNLHEHESADALADALRAAARHEYGTPGRAFLIWLLDRLEAEPGFIDHVKARIEAIAAHWLARFDDAGGQVRSVARRFALVAIAGELATRAGITGWQMADPAEAAGELFATWLTERGTAGASEDERAVQQLAAFILRNNARFEVINHKKTGEELYETVDNAPVEKLLVHNRAGWRRWDVTDGTGAWVYFVLPDAMREALVSLDFSPAIRVLVERGILQLGRDGKPQQKNRIPNFGTPRHYVVPDPSKEPSRAMAAE